MMKKLLLGLLVLALIVGLSAWGVTVSGHRWQAGRLQRVTSQTVDLTTVPQRLNLRIRTAQVTVQAGKRAQVTLTNVTPNQFQVHTGKTLTIRQPNAAQHRLELGASPRIVVTLPAPVNLAATDIFLLNGTLTLNHLTSQRLTVEQVNGTTRSTGLTLPRGGTFTKKNGQTTFQHLQSSGISVTVKTGGVTVNGRKGADQRHYSRAGQHPFVIQNHTGQVKLTD